MQPPLHPSKHERHFPRTSFLIPCAGFRGWGALPPSDDENMPSYGSNDGYGAQRLGLRPSTRQSAIGAAQRNSSQMAALLAEEDIERPEAEAHSGQPATQWQGCRSATATRAPPPPSSTFDQHSRSPPQNYQQPMPPSHAAPQRCTHPFEEHWQNTEGNEGLRQLQLQQQAALQRHRVQGYPQWPVPAHAGDIGGSGGMRGRGQAHQPASPPPPQPPARHTTMSPAREYELAKREEGASYQLQQQERQRQLEARVAHLSPQERKEARIVDWIQGGNPWASQGFTPMSETQGRREYVPSSPPPASFLGPSAIAAGRLQRSEERMGATPTGPSSFRALSRRTPPPPPPAEDPWMVGYRA